MKTISYIKRTPTYMEEVECDVNSFTEEMMARSPSIIGPLCICLLYGLRLKDALRLLWRDIDFVSDVIHIHRNMNNFGEPVTSLNTGESTRSIPLPKMLKEVFLKLRSGTTPHPDKPVFNRNGIFFRDIHMNRKLHLLTKDSPYEGIRLYDLRRAFQGSQKPRDYSFNGFRHSMAKRMGLTGEIQTKAMPYIPDLIRLAILRHPASYGSVLGLMSYTDLSLGETIGLHWEDIDFQNNNITVRRTIDDQLNVLPPKSGEHNITLTPESKAFLTQYRNVRQRGKNTPQVFHNNGRYLHISSLVKRMQRLVAERGRKGLSGHELMRYANQIKQLRHVMAADH